MEDHSYLRQWEVCQKRRPAQVDLSLRATSRTPLKAKFGPGLGLWEGGRPGQREDTRIAVTATQPPDFENSLRGRARRISPTAHLLRATGRIPLGGANSYVTHLRHGSLSVHKKRRHKEGPASVVEGTGPAIWDGGRRAQEPGWVMVTSRRARIVRPSRRSYAGFRYTLRAIFGLLPRSSIRGAGSRRNPAPSRELFA